MLQPDTKAAVKNQKPLLIKKTVKNQNYARNKQVNNKLQIYYTNPMAFAKPSLFDGIVILACLYIQLIFSQT